MSIVNLVNQIASIHASKNPKLSSRYNLFPPSDQESFEFYKKQEGAMWSSNEFEYTRDVKDFDAIPENERKMLKCVLGFFAPGDGLISENLIFRFLLECETYEEKSMFIAQLFIELVHAETYGTTIQTLLHNEKEREDLLDAVDTAPPIRAKAEWMERYLFADLPRAERLAAFACAEGIFFCSLFMFIFWFRSRGILPNLIASNEKISQDERLHRDYGAMLYRRYKNQTNSSRILDIVKSAVEVEKQFIEFILQEPVSELNQTNALQFVQSVADNLLVQFGLEPHWGVKNPYTWMNDISLQQKGNFYEVRISSYKQFSLAEAMERTKGAKEAKDLTEVDF
jgi:ribonucleoside-diphosphate reductase beta chain